MILRIVVLASVMALAHSQADGYYSASEPNTWVREAQREATILLSLAAPIDLPGLAAPTRRLRLELGKPGGAQLVHPAVGLG